MADVNPFPSSEILEKYKDSTSVGMEVNKDTWETMPKEEYVDKVQERTANQKKHGKMMDLLHAHKIYISTVYNTMKELQYLCNKLMGENSDNILLGYSLSASLQYPLLLVNTILGFNDESYYFEHEATEKELLILKSLINDVAGCIPHFNAKVELAFIRVALKNCSACIDSYLEVTKKEDENATST